MELAGAAEVAVPEMIECHRGLDQPLVELPRFAPILGPQRLPNLVALEVVAGIEMTDPLEIERIVGGLGGHGAVHAGGGFKVRGAWTGRRDQRATTT